MNSPLEPPQLSVDFKDRKTGLVIFGILTALIGLLCALFVPLMFFGVIYVILPGAWVLFYRSRHVKATCESYDPMVRWTDHCPLPVLAVSLWLTFSALMMLVMAVVYKGILPMFGSFVAGPV